MNPWKLAAAAIFTVVLGAQLAAVIRPPPPGWYWPFLNYPMYSRAYYAGDSLQSTELRIQSCASEAEERTIGYQDVRIPPFRYRDMLSRLAQDEPLEADQELSRAAALLARRLDQEFAGAYCVARVWVRTFVLGEAGWEDLDPPWRLAREWRIGQVEGDHPAVILGSP